MLPDRYWQALGRWFTMTETCDLCGPTIGRVELREVGDDLLLLCYECTERVFAHRTDTEGKEANHGD